MRLQLESEHLGNELFLLEVGLQVGIGLHRGILTMMRRYGNDVPKKAPSASADFFLGE